MLLRSSSTPLFRSFSSKELEPEAKIGGSSFPCLFSSNFQASQISCVSVSCDDNFAHESLKRDLERGIARLQRVRRVKSVNDLQTLGKKYCSPAEVAADSFWTSHGNEGSFEKIANAEHCCPRPKQCSRHTSPRGHSSVLTIVSGHFSLGSEEKILLQEDLLRRQQSGPVLQLDAETNMLTDCSSTELDKNVGQMEASATKRSYGRIEKRNLDANFEFHKKDNKARSPSRSEWHGPDFSKESDVGVSCQQRSGRASLSGRKDQNYRIADVDNRYRCISKESSGVAVVARGYKPCRESEKLGLSVGMTGDGNGNGNGGYGDSGGGWFHSDSGNPDEYYKTMLKADPNNPLLLSNYARFLFEVPKDYKRAEEFLGRAILAMPGEGEVLAQYASLIWQVYRDTDRAANYFEQAVQAAPADPYVLAANASFIWASEADEEESIKPFVSSLPTYRPATVVSA